MECTKNYNARAQPLFRSLNLLFSNVAVAVAVAVVAFLNSLLLDVRNDLMEFVIFSSVHL